MANQINPYHHLLFWLLFSLSFAVLEWGYNNTFWEALELEVMMLPARLLAVYGNWIYLIPLFLYRGKVRNYILSLLALLVTATLLHRLLILNIFYPIFFPDWVYLDEVETFLENGVTKERIVRTFKVPFWKPYHLLQSLIVIGIPVVFTTGWKFLLDWYRERKRTQQLEQEKTEAELKYLKSQINPHFLFNTLNNIYGLARERSEKVPEMILKLSDILHYTLYETKGQRIDLSKELQLIEYMVGLEEDRYGDRVQVRLEKPDTLPDLRIAPLLLVPLVENAFKHGVWNELESAQVAIHVTFAGNEFTFTVNNTVARDEESIRPVGLGLENLRKRLALLYPDSHQLSLSETAGRFTAILQIRLES